MIHYSWRCSSDHPQIQESPPQPPSLPHLLSDEEVMMNDCSLKITGLISFLRAGGWVLAFHMRFYWVTLPRSTRGRCCWPEPREKEKTKNTGWHLQLGLPPPLLDMTLGCNSPLPINYSQEKTWGWNYMFVLPCWQNRLNIHTHTFCRSNMQIVTPHCS